jgi:hypothetical protein
MLAELWNGKSWTIETTNLPAGGSDATLSSVSCPAITTCEAIGSYEDGGEDVPLDQAWNGKSFVAEVTPSIPNTRFMSLDAVSCSSTTNCQAVGSVEHKGPDQTSQLLAETFSGKSWGQTPVEGVGIGPNGFEGVSCYATNACIGVGYYTDSSETQNLLAEQFG